MINPLFEDDWREAMIVHGNQMIDYASPNPRCMFDDAIFFGYNGNVKNDRLRNK